MIELRLVGLILMVVSALLAMVTERGLFYVYVGIGVGFIILDMITDKELSTEIKNGMY